MLLTLRKTDSGSVERVGGVAELPLEAIGLEALEDEIAVLGAHLAAGMCRWIELVGELDRREVSFGWCSLPAWLAWRCGLSLRAAREHVRVARALRELPGVRAAFAGGVLSYAKVRALTRVAQPESEGELLELAEALTAAQLERTLGAYRRVTIEEARSLQEREELRWWWDEDGSLVLRGRLAPEDGALVLRALEAARDRLWESGSVGEGGSAEPPAVQPAPVAGGGSAEPPLEQRRPSTVDVLVAVADASLADGPGRSGGDRYQVVVHVDRDSLIGDGDGCCGLEDGPAIAAETARRLACDASLPGCTNTRLVDAHHIDHWARGGGTALGNLVLLCRRHHRLVHEGGYRVDREMRFFDPRGKPIPAVPPARAGSLGVLRAAHRHLAIDAGAGQGGIGERASLATLVDAVIDATRPRSPGFL